MSMEPTLPPASGIIRRPQPAAENNAPQVPAGPPKPYLKRMFQGRLNRQNYSLGSLLLIGVPLVCFAIFFGSVLSSSGALSWLLINPFDANQLHSATIQSENIEKSLTDLHTSELNRIILIVLVVYMFLTLPINLAMQIRRLHDMNNSGWLLLFNIVPFVGYLFPFYITFFPGTNGENKYGPKPVARTNVREDILMLQTGKNPAKLSA